MLWWGNAEQALFNNTLMSRLNNLLGLHFKHTKRCLPFVTLEPVTIGKKKQKNKKKHKRPQKVADQTSYKNN